MLSLFKRKIVQKKAPILATKTEQIIANIHRAFDTAAEDAVAEANAILNKNVNEENHNRGMKLLSLGFTSSKTAVEHKQIEDERIKAHQRAEIVSKWAIKYPQYKFIFRDQVEAICEKYGLLCGTVDHYKGEVPGKNIEEIANFTVSDEDIYFQREIGRFRWTDQFDFASERNYISQAEIMREKQHYDQQIGSAISESYKKILRDRLYDQHERKVPLFICAPAADMEIGDRDRVVGKFIQHIPDPIVLHFVKDGYLIVSKWGLEGNDPALVNENMN